MYCCAVSFIAFVSHLFASMALVVVIGEVTSVRVMAGQRTARGTNGLSESCGQNESVASDRRSIQGHSVPQYSAVEFKLSRPSNFY
jgi:hypothetical protein